MASEPENIYQYCVTTLREKIPDLPKLNAIDFPINTITPKVGDVIKMKYPKYYHMALIIGETENSWEIYQGNIPAGATSTEWIDKDDPKILGYFNMDRQRLIDTLPKEQRDVLWCESGWSMYDTDGSHLKGTSGEIGVAQFMKNTWGWAEDLRRKENKKRILLDRYNFEDQIENFKFMWELGYKDHWHALDSECFRNRQ